MPGPSVKMKRTEVDFVKVKKEEKKINDHVGLLSRPHVVKIRPNPR